MPIAKNTIHGTPHRSRVSERKEQGREDNRDREAQAEMPLDRCSGHVDDGKCRSSEQDLFDDGSDGDSVEQCCR